MINGIEQLLEAISDELNISESEFGSIEKSYNSVGDWLNAKDSSLREYGVEIIPQGSMRLGTVVKPIDENDYDVDLVCKLTKGAENLSSTTLKEKVGARLKEHGTYNQMIKESNRCWTLTYCDKLNYHMDVLPARIKGDMLEATDKRLDSYIPTNPEGYFEWFLGRMKSYTELLFQRGFIEELPQYPRKTPLQRVIQLLKRHRDVQCSDNLEIAPISIIITTLCGLAYNGEDNIIETLKNLVKNMANFIDKDESGSYSVINPSNAEENFADKWQKQPEKREEFYNWLSSLNIHVKQLEETLEPEVTRQILYRMFNSKVVDRAINEFGGMEKLVKDNSFSLVSHNSHMAMDLSHRAKHPLPVAWKVSVGITCEVYDVNNEIKLGEYKNDGEPLDKGLRLRFYAKHSCGQNPKIKWQITNTGIEAKNNNGLRGELIGSNIELGGRRECLSYKGSHIVQCYVWGGSEWKKSDEFIVNIK
ncbi:MAG: nucleotidyltransferase [Bacillota bacterium]